jgi:hypothetical protein
MCLVKVKQEEDVIVPVRRVVRTRSPSPHRRRSSHQRISRTSIVRESRPQSSTYLARPPSAPYVAIPAPKPGPMIPAPQPVPVFVQPPPPPPPPPVSHHHGHHFVEVSPRSSYSSSPSRSEYVVHEREYRRERDYSPDSPRYESFRYVESAPEEQHYDHLHYSRRERSRSRSRDTRGRGQDPRGSYHETRERVLIVDDDGRRRREYRR